jgi:hypothetical protein
MHKCLSIIHACTTILTTDATKNAYRKLHAYRKLLEHLSYINPPDFSFSTTQLKYGTQPTVCYSTVDPPTSLRCYPATAIPTLLFRYNGCRYSLNLHQAINTYNHAEHHASAAVESQNRKCIIRRGAESVHHREPGLSADHISTRTY